MLLIDKHHQHGLLRIVGPHGGAQNRRRVHHPRGDFGLQGNDGPNSGMLEIERDGRRR